MQRWRRFSQSEVKLLKIGSFRRSAPKPMIATGVASEQRLPEPPPKPAPGVRFVEVPEDREGQRLDNFLFGQLKGAPKSLVYRLLRTGQVRVNGKRAKPDTRIAAGDKLRLPPVRLGESAPPARASDRSLVARYAGLPARLAMERVAALPVRCIPIIPPVHSRASCRGGVAREH